MRYLNKLIAIEPVRHIRLSDYIELTKPGITMMVCLTTLSGFFLAGGNSFDFLLIHTLIGTALIASGASALNMALEWESDGTMRRTKVRPIPAGRLSPACGLTFGSVISFVGAVELFYVNFLTGLLATLSLLLYVLVYTPLKRKTWLSTIVGAIPGALPPVMGWTAAQNEITLQACWLFAVLFLWQLPHFLAIGWIYRQDYTSAGFPLLSVIDCKGKQTSRLILITIVDLILVSLFPVEGGNFPRAYQAGALLVGITFLVTAVRFTLFKSNVRAKQLFLASVIYLPLLLALRLLM
jgi:protoheme IX farnesyltransferase